MIKRSSSFLAKIVMFLLVLSLVSPLGVDAGKWGGGGYKPPVKGEKGTLTIHKYKQDKGDKKGHPTGEEGQEVVGDPVEGVTFTVKQTHKFDPDKNKWTQVGRYNAPTFTFTTGADGKVSKELPLGRYEVQETDAPPHIVKNTKKFYVEIPMTNKKGTKLNYDVHIYPKNEKVKGHVNLKKTDGDKKKHNALRGVKFKLFNEDGTPYNDKTYTTDSRGQIEVKHLPYGDYYFQEIETINGYVLGNPEVDFSIKKHKKTVNVHVKNYVEPEAEKSVNKKAVNRGETVNFSIKSTLPGDINSYNTYKITDELDHRLAYVDGSWSVEGIPESAINFSQNGQTLTWEIVKFYPLKGKKNFTISFDAKVSKDAKPNKKIYNKGIVEYENKYGNGREKETNKVKVVPTAGNVKIIKQDAKKGKWGKHKRLKGAKFELRDSDDQVVASGKTNSNGELEFKNIDYGEYTLHETKAPKGYRLLAEPIDVKINKFKSDETYTINNYKSDYDLPATGGIGTMLFTFVGLSLMGGASYMFVRRRRGENA